MFNIEALITAGTKAHDTCHGQEFSEIELKISIQRKSLYYYINFLIPTMVFSYMSIFVWGLPRCSGEKLLTSEFLYVHELKKKLSKITKEIEKQM